MKGNCSICESLPREGGIYLLVVELANPAALRVAGREIRLEAVHYVYVGSAWGPGGLRARLCRHLGCRARRSLHWHIDRLLASGGRVVGFSYSPGAPRELECLVAAVAVASRCCVTPNVPVGGTDDRYGFPHLLPCTFEEACMHLLYTILPSPLHICTLKGGGVWECCGPL